MGWDGMGWDGMGWDGKGGWGGWGNGVGVRVFKCIRGKFDVD